LSFDTYVHFYFGLVGALIVARGLEEGVGVRGWRLWLATVLCLLGLGAIHELVEFASTLGLGSKIGMYKMDDPDQFDTQKDLFNNLLGALTGLSLASLYRSAMGTGISSPAAP
jgi:uncharacterized membrane protein YjdF